MTRKVANWFHDREGELFTADETPFTREEIVQVINDSIDPVQQVMVEGEKYIGVISYEEHNGWYEYTRWDDAAGEVNMGVCAKCVEEAEYVDEVSRTLGDSTDIAQEKFENHYSDDHTVKPDEIETGATLLSGTTINSNEAIHPGMDGSGSGVDADFVKGNEPLQTGSFFSFSESSGLFSAQEKFVTPSSGPTDIGLDSSDSIWITEEFSSVYEVNQSGTIQTQLNKNIPVGIDSDSNDCIWVYAHDPNNLESVFKLDQSGTELTNYVPNNGSGSSLTIDSNDSIIYVESSSEKMYKENQSGTLIFERSLFRIDPIGVGSKTNDSLYTTFFATESIYVVDENQNKLNGFKTPRTGITNPNYSGIDEDSNSSLWFVRKQDRQVFQSPQIPSTSIEF